MEWILDVFFLRALAASVFAGLACGIAGVWVYLLNIPFVGVAMAHTAFAGAVIGLFFGFNPVASAIILCMAASVFIGPVAEKGKFSANISTGILFSVMLGIAFLFMAKLKTNAGEAFAFMWGSILTVSGKDFQWLAVVAVIAVAFLVVFRKGIIAVIYNRQIAEACGIPEKFIFYSLLVLCAVTVSVNIKITGGLLIYSLITLPPAAAAQFTRKLKNLYIISAAVAVMSCVLGLFASYMFDLPAGAAIIITAAAIFAVSFPVNKKIRSLYEKKVF